MTGARPLANSLCSVDRGAVLGERGLSSLPSSVRSRDLLGEEGRVCPDPTKQRRASGVLPRSNPEGGDRMMQSRPVGGGFVPARPSRRDVDPGVVGLEPGRPTTAKYSETLPSANVTLRPVAIVARGRIWTPCRLTSWRGPHPITWSRAARRLPNRVPTVTRSSLIPLAHHQMSRPNGRCGIVGIRWPAEISTAWVAESSRAIWQPEFAAPTTSTLPAGRDCGW